MAFIYRKIERKGHFGIEYCLWITEFPGALYLVAPNPQIIQRVFERVHTVYVNRGITLVPQEDCDVLCRMLRDEDVPFKAGDWVRVKKKGLYKDDVGCVLNADLPNSTITMLLRPRLSYVNGQQFTRPLPALFDPDRARVVFGPGSVQGDDATQCFSFQGMSFQHGFLKCSFPLRQLVTKDVLPKFSEIENFYSHLMTMTPPWDWSRCKWYRDDYFNSLRTGDRIRVEQGEGMGQVGYLVGVKEYGVVEVRLTAEINADLSQDLELELLAHQTVRAFKAGDYIMIRHGVHAGIRGHVAEVGKTTLKVIALRSDNLGLCPDMVRRINCNSYSILTFVADPGPDRTLYSFPP